MRRQNGQGTITKRKDGRYQVMFGVGTQRPGDRKRLVIYAHSAEEAESLRQQIASEGVEKYLCLKAARRTHRLAKKVLHDLLWSGNQEALNMHAGGFGQQQISPE